MSVFDEAYMTRPFLLGKLGTEELMYAIDKFSITGEALELGCGDGRDTYHVLKKGMIVTAIDQSQHAINTLNNRTDLSTDEKSRLNAICEDVTRIDLGVNMFDFVYAITLFDHLDKTQGNLLLGNVLQHINIGGYIFIKVHTVNDVGNTHKSSEISEFVSEIKHFYETDELLRNMLLHGQVLYYLETSELDLDHGKPHTHAFASILIRKDK